MLCMAYGSRDAVPESQAVQPAAGQQRSSSAHQPGAPATAMLMPSGPPWPGCTAKLTGCSARALQSPKIVAVQNSSDNCCRPYGCIIQDSYDNPIKERCKRAQPPFQFLLRMTGALCMTLPLARPAGPACLHACMLAACSRRAASSQQPRRSDAEGRRRMPQVGGGGPAYAYALAGMPILGQAPVLPADMLCPSARRPTTVVIDQQVYLGVPGYVLSPGECAPVAGLRWGLVCPAQPHNHWGLVPIVAGSLQRAGCCQSEPHRCE